jgi:hypothetical protein
MSAWGKLHAATLELAKATPIKQRLTNAFSKHLKHIDASQLPPALRCELHDLLRGLEAVAPLPGETPVLATVRKMSTDDADLFATRIVVLFGEVARAAMPVRSHEPAAAEPRLERFADDGHNVVPLLYAAEA